MPKSKTTAKQNMLKTYQKAVRLMHKKSYEKAAELFSQVTESSEDNHRLAAQAASQLKACQSQIRKTQKTEIEPPSSYDMGVFHHNGGDYDQAIDLFTAALEHSEQKGHIYLAMAATEACRGNTESAVESLQESILIDSTNQILAQNDPDLESLSGNPAFKKLLQTN